ncbi:hypothetical protein [Rhodococcus marinonascens]|uniref:hypothetical protein n=1 Tax=Rhodococcus marinonascens TaxID=38311 RepID=UPI0009324668|nr:hypothetical protein [Rhodococcus marinonascens]
MDFRKIARRAVTAAATLLVLTAPAVALAPAANAAQVYPFGTDIRMRASGNIASITLYSTGANATQISIKYTAGAEGIEGWELRRPSLTYGPSGIPAASNYEHSSGTFSGFVAPYTSVTLKWAYKVNYKKLNPATMTASIGFDEDYIWSGDLGTRIANLLPPPPPPPPAPFGSFGS